MRLSLANIILLLCLCGFSPFISNRAAAQPSTSDQEIADLQTSAETALREAQQASLDALAPKNYERARRAYDEARALQDKNGEPTLVAMKYKISLDEIEAGRTFAQNVREQIPSVLAARIAARDVAADSLAPTAWERAELQLAHLVRELESGHAVAAADADDAAGSYRAARRDALRRGVLGDAWDLRDEMDRRRAEKTLPTLTLRVNQALSRAEAALSQENLDLARIEGTNAARLAWRTLGLLDHIERSQRAVLPWEAAILPYDDIVNEIAEDFGATLDYSQGVSAAGRPLMEQIGRKQDSLRTRVADLEQANTSLETSLSEAQTSLADAQNRIVELERRMSAAEGERSTARAKLQVTEQIARAQDHFAPGDASVLQNERGQVVIRLLGLRFASGATKLDKAASKLLNEAVGAINEFSGASIAVEGHTDSDGGDDQNQKLSAARAKAVGTFLAKAMKLPNDQIVASGFGESRPISDNKTREGKAMNRRIEIVLTLPQ